MATCFLTQAELADLLRSAPAERMFGPVATAHGPRFVRVERDEADKIALTNPRPPSSPKSLLFPPRERVAFYGEDAPAVDDPADTGPTLVVGLPNCDLQAFALLDKILIEGDFTEPFYAARRQSLVLIGVDCVDPPEGCFCVAVGGAPSVADGCDLALSPVDGGFVAEPLTDAGKELIVHTSRSFREPTPGEFQQRDSVRARAQDQVAKQSSGFQLPEDSAQRLDKLGDSPKWATIGKICVECGACTNICPTCHCFFIHDQPIGEKQYERVRTWDSCVYSDYSRMAGLRGMKANPRAELRSRLANRVLHKYAYIPNTYGPLGCTGCGRCVEACFGGSDIRDVVSELLQ